MSNPYKLEAGQELWFQSWFSSQLSRNVTLEKIGRKYATIKGWRDDFRLDMQSLRLELKDYGGKGRCWLSREAYEKDDELSKAWLLLKNEIYGLSQPAHITLEQIEQIRQMISHTKSE
jgi:hypothetical protein